MAPSDLHLDARKLASEQRLISPLAINEGWLRRLERLTYSAVLLSGTKRRNILTLWVARCAKFNGPFTDCRSPIGQFVFSDLLCFMHEAQIKVGGIRIFPIHQFIVHPTES